LRFGTPLAALGSRMAVYGKSVFSEGALSAKTKQLIAVAAAHVTHCPYCIRGHTGATARGAGGQGTRHSVEAAVEVGGNVLGLLPIASPAA
jgi:AhpD family alkylhydroperoxidase